MKAVCIIPARYQSTRLPGKPLLDIAGKPMIQWVAERALRAKTVDEVIVATDDVRIFATVESFGGKAVMTSSAHRSGTDRLAELAARMTDVDLIVNVQGDEPLIDPMVIDQLVESFNDRADILMATMMTQMDAVDYNNPAAVKVATTLDGFALYFSRAAIPYPRENTGKNLFKHVGIYAYRRDFLLTFAKWKPTPLEMAESLEQLRALEHGVKIRVLETPHASCGVDTPADLERVRLLLAKN